MLFSDLPLNEALLNAVKNEGFSKATPIQSEAIPACIEGKDIIATASTGTGKTVAFSLPLIQRLMESDGKKPRALILTPTRELADQIYTTIQRLTRGTKLSAVAIYGGVPMYKQVTALRAKKDIIIACPGRLLDHMRQKNIRIDSVEILVLDEADRMLDMGFSPDVKKIVSETSSERQTLLFSATFASGVERLSKDILRAPVRISVGLQSPPKTIDHSFYPITQDRKTALLEAFLRTNESLSAIVFTKTKHKANKISEMLSTKGFKANAIHGNKTQSQRARALESFKKGRINILVATDVAARGIDIQNVSHVINYDMPDSAEGYIHRIGRTGRAEQKGIALSFVTVVDRNDMRQIERVLGNPVRKDILPDFDYGSCDPASMFADKPASSKTGRRFSPRNKFGKRR